MIEDITKSCWPNYWNSTVRSVYDGNAALAERFKLVWYDNYLRVESGQLEKHIEPFIRGYGRIQNPDPSLFELLDPLPAGKPIFGPALMNSTSLGPKAWGLVPLEGKLLYKIGWDRSHTWYMVADADGQHALFQRDAGAPSPPPHVVRSIQYAQLPAESRERVATLLEK